MIDQVDECERCATGLTFETAVRIEATRPSGEVIYLTTVCESCARESGIDVPEAE